MADQKEYKNGQSREPEKKPEIGHDDVENLIDFGDPDDEEIVDVEEDLEALSEAIQLQVADEAGQFLPPDEDAEEEVLGDMPEVLYDFDPENQGGESLEEGEQIVVEQQVLDLAGVLIEMVEEHVEEEQGQMEAVCDNIEQAPPQVENPSNQGPEDQAEIREASNAGPVNERLEPFTSGDSAVDQDGNEEPSVQDANDQDMNSGSSSSEQGSNGKDLNGESSTSGHAPVADQNMNDEQSEFDQRLNRGLKEQQSESGQSSSDQNRNGGPSRSGRSSNNHVRDGGPSCSGRGLIVDRNLNAEQLGSCRPSESGQGPSAQDQNDGPSRLGNRSSVPVDRNLNEEQSGSCQPSGPSESGNRSSVPVDRNLNEEQSGSCQPSGPSESGQGPSAQEQNDGPSRSGNRSPVVQSLNEGRLRSSHEYNGVSSGIASILNKDLNEGPSRSVQDRIEQQIQGDVDVCEEIMELDEVEVNVPAHSIRDIGIERQRILERNIGSRDQIMEAVNALDLNGEPNSGPDPSEQREKVGQVAANEAVALPGAAAERPVDHVEGVLDQNDVIPQDEQDNLVEEVQVLPGPLEGAIGGQVNVVAEEQDVAAEVQSIQKTD